MSDIILHNYSAIITFPYILKVIKIYNFDVQHVLVIAQPTCCFIQSAGSLTFLSYKGNK